MSTQKHGKIYFFRTVLDWVYALVAADAAAAPSGM
jgi:hypothetical protein